MMGLWCLQQTSPWAWTHKGAPAGCSVSRWHWYSAGLRVLEQGGAGWPMVGELSCWKVWETMGLQGEELGFSWAPSKTSC